MSRHKKKKKIKKFNNYNTVSLQDEIQNINSKILNTSEEIYDLKGAKIKLVEELAEIFLNNTEANSILTRYVDVDKKIKNLQESNKNRLIDIENKKKKLEIEDLERIQDQFAFKQIGDVNYTVGLFNKRCDRPVAICKKKNVYLSYDDIKNKRCLKHKNKPPCKHLKWLTKEETIF